MYSNQLNNSRWFMPKDNGRMLVPGNGGRRVDRGCKDMGSLHLYSAMTARYLSSAARYSDGYLRSALVLSFLL